MLFTFKKLEIPDVVLIEPTLFSDERGFFCETFKTSEFSSNGISTTFVQENFSHSVKNVIRGLHFQQNPKAQSKLVSVVSGKIFDVAVDIRKNSLTFGKWVGEILSHDNHKSLFVPVGFAHGFCVLSDEADVLYKVDNEYSPNDESGIIWNDSSINISWPTNNPIISYKDNQYPSLENSKNNFL
ncbi:dTDP-4-dehydrorhamnose 3,5-epimerase [Nitrosopumilus sp. b2]|uniref:dTDP-4-dehydrorhamnose 3,5-epimerase n=1 Tax=Nitrosopumilus sp. b2 TaxID=2109908 RepID=UPI0015F5E46F|nr:dTDP-4-dehydrorhamnose 3,5-epimerase [Nitrosopumilus sp. b2]KAF6246075.1 dTDP-4-dehydrorhamnose 3,5-epimerase [Nitrosopumilus sp. b2]